MKLIEYARTRIEGAIKSRLVQATSSPLLGYLVPFLPYQPAKNAYVVERIDVSQALTPETLPVPPQQLWLGYGQNAETYLDSGKRHIESMRALLGQHGWTSSGPVLDFGCGAGRMTRWLLDDASTNEIWGTDISAEHIIWCKQHLSPPFHFVTTTTLPHLPFEDNTFSLIYAGSVFSHIDDLADAWVLELRRITKRGGFLYLTFMDEHTIAALARPEWRSFWLSRYLYGQPQHESLLGSRYAMFTLGRAMRAQVFYDLDYITKRLHAWFDVLSTTPGGYGFQTAIVLRKP